MGIKSYLIFFSVLLVMQNAARADAIYTTVFNVFESKKTERLLVLSAVDGRIYKSFKNEANLNRLKSMIGKVVRLDFSLRNDEAIISNIQLANPNEIDSRTMDLNHFRYNQLRTFAPTDLQSYEKVEEVFNEMLNDGDKNRSQCFKRAHMWSYDMWAKSNIYSQKIFMFYTKRYQILEDFDWWFHVAPMVVAGGIEYVLDGTFMSKPIPVKEWYSWFIKTDKITCPELNDYKDLEEGQWKRLCFLMKVPMYHFSPLDIENRDRNGEERNHWILDELQDARRAFRNWDEKYEGLDSGKPTKKY